MYSGRIMQETSNSRLIDKEWGKDSDYIYNWYTEDRPISELRFIIRDGQRVLQAKYFVRVEFSEPLFRFDFGNGGNIEFETRYMWLDVPLEEE